MRHGVLHIVSEGSYHESGNQLRLLLEHAQDPPWEWHIAAPSHVEFIKRVSPFAKMFILPMHGLFFLSAILRLALYVKRQKIVLVHAQGARAHELGICLRILFPHLRLLVNWRDEESPKDCLCHRFVFRRSYVDRFVCSSLASQSALQSYGLAKERLQVIRDGLITDPSEGIDAAHSRRELFKEWGIEADCPTIGSIAPISPAKDHATMILALAKLRDQGIRFFAYIAGEGELREAATRLANELRLGPETLRFLGCRKDIPQLLAATDIFACSAKTGSFGTILLDAMASGCAILATSIGGIREIVVDQETGLLSPIHDADAYADNLRILLEDPELARSYAAYALLHAQEHFSANSKVTRTLELYRALLDG